MNYEHFVMGNIYVLLVVNALLVLTVIGYKVAYEFSRDRKNIRIERLLPRVREEMDKSIQGLEMDRVFIVQNNRRHVYQAMLKVVGETGQDYHQAFDQLGFTDNIIHRIENRGDYTDLELIKQLLLIQSPRSAEVLFAQIGSSNVEKAYRAAYVLCGMHIDDPTESQIMKALLDSRINRQRTIELIERLRPSLGLLLSCLPNEKNENKRAILLLALKNRDDVKGNTELLKTMAPFLYSSIEASIAAVEVTAAIGGLEAFQVLNERLEAKPAWEIRSRIARVLPRFEAAYSVLVLKVLSEDDSWWVRFNALNALARMGKTGLDTILDLALNSSQPETASLAYQMLNASADVFATVYQLDKEKQGYENNSLGI